MASKPDSIVALAARMARIETRLARLSIALGVSPYGGKVTTEGLGALHVEDGTVIIPHLDVSLLDIRQFLTAHKAPPGEYLVVCGGSKTATIFLT